MVRILLIAAALVWPAAVSANGVSTLQCVFDVMASPLAESTKKANLKFTVLIDRRANRAHMVGDSGMNEMLMHTGNRAVSFIEMLGNGAVHSLTIYAIGVAVYSRQGVMGQTPLPSQYTGVCSPAKITSE